MGKVDRFEDLRIWKDARIMVKEIYNDFQNCNDWGFKDQIQRSAISIMNNIAEGFERRSIVRRNSRFNESFKILGFKDIKLNKV